MTDFSLSALIVALCILLALSAFFSASETALIALKRYRLNGLAKKQHPGALRASQLLQRSDLLFGSIQIGKITVIVAATVITAILAIRLWGESWLPFAAAIFTLAVLIFSTFTPKALASQRPEVLAFAATSVLLPLVKLLSPLVWLLNLCSRALLRPFGLEPSAAPNHKQIATEELRSIIDESADPLPVWHRQVLLKTFDLERTTVEDIMLPRSQVIGLNLQDDMAALLKTIRSSEYTRLPVFDGDINKIVGVLHLRDVARFLHGADETITHDAIRRFSQEPYFAPLGTPLYVQLQNFQKQKQRMAFVVDEYGDVQGLVTLEALLEEIVGDFTTRLAEEDNKEIQSSEDGWYLVDASASVREVNRRLNWDLPTGSAKTVNGLMMEYLQSIPAGNACCQIGNYRFKTCKLGDKRIDQAKVKRVRTRPSQAKLF